MEYKLLKGGTVTYFSQYIPKRKTKLLWDELNPTEIYKQTCPFETINNTSIEVETKFGKNKNSPIIWKQLMTDYYKTKNGNSPEDSLTYYPRLSSSMFEPHVNPKVYLNSDTQDIGLKTWTPLVKELKEQIENEFDETISYAILNYYANTNNYINYHSDREMKENDKIFSISLGISRNFGFRQKFNDNTTTLKTSGPPEIKLDLQNGSLVVFDYEAGNKNYKHSLFKGLKRDGHSCMKDSCMKDSSYTKCDAAMDWCGCARINITFRTFYTK